MPALIELILLLLGTLTAFTIIYIAVIWFVIVPLSNFVKWLAGE